MGRFLAGLTALLCCAAFVGAVGHDAPAIPSKNFFINDYANVIEQENRDTMLKLAQRLYEEKDVCEVLLTVESLGNYTPAQYAQKIFDSWEIAAKGEIGALILISTEDKRVIVKSNADIASTYSMDVADNELKDGNFNEAAKLYFFAVADSISGAYPSGDGADIVSVPESGSAVSSGEGAHTAQAAKAADAVTEEKNAKTQRTSSREDVFYLISFVLFLFIFMRAVRISFRYRKKYLNNKSYYRGYSPANVYKRMPTRPARRDDDDYPSGFGGLGNRNAIYGENLDEADDVGIIKRDCGEASDDGRTDSPNTNDNY